MQADIKNIEKMQFLFGQESDFSLNTSKYVILPIPMEKTTSYMKGTQFGPHKIVEASTQLEYFDSETKTEPCHSGIFTDWSLGKNPENFNKAESKDIVKTINEHVSKLLDQDKWVISLGGEHTISVGTVPPFVEKYKDNITLLHIDAHADLKDSYEGNQLSHACVMKRLLGQLPIVSVGIRSIDKEEFQLIESSEGLDVMYSEEVHQNPNWIEKVLSQIKTDHVYLSFDLDGLDPSVVPGLGTPEPGGLGWFDALNLIRKTCEAHKLVGADFNEICPSQIPLYSEITACKLIYKTIAYTQL